MKNIPRSSAILVSRRGVLMAEIVAMLLPRAAIGAALTGSVSWPDPDAPNAPAVHITNGTVNATLYLPDAENGYYRGTRFDWSGIIAQLEMNGHSYFGRWFADYDPLKHDAVTGLAQDWVTGQGFEAAPIGGTFVKVGVGVLRKPAEPIRGFPTLEIVDPGRWTTRVRPDAVDFIHEVEDPASGYGYRYIKTVLLPAGRQEMVLLQRIESTGVHAIDTQMYNHNFFVLDKQPSGPITCPFVLKPFNACGDAVEVTENRKSGAGVVVTSGKPLSDLVFWSSPRTICPEPYIHVYADRDAPMDWETTYRFYSLLPAQA